MISNKTFVTWNRKGISSEIFMINEGLQQGTVNSPILFNLYTSDLPNLFQFNELEKASAIVFADDMIIYVSSNRVGIVPNKLENTVQKVNNYFTQWNLKINPS